MITITTTILIGLLSFQSLESISKELVAKLQTRLAHWDVNTTLIGDVLVEMVCYDLLSIRREDFLL